MFILPALLNDFVFLFNQGKSCLKNKEVWALFGPNNFIP
jgi:hypothetical protein